MHDITELIKFILNPLNIGNYLKVSVVFLGLIIIGLVTHTAIFTTKKNKVFTIASSMVLGPCFYVLFLSAVSYLFKGYVWTNILFWLLCLGAAVIIYRQRKDYAYLIRYNSTISTIALTVALLTFIGLLFLFVGNTVIGGDVMSQWPLATSFVRGNYPTVLPWQPNQLSAYHQGTFMVLGSLSAVSGITIGHIHYFFSFYIITALFLLITGIVRERSSGLFVFIPGGLAVVLCGPLFLIKDPAPLINTIVSSKTVDITLVRKIAEFPQFSELKSYIGSGVTNISLMVFLNFITFSIATSVLFVYILNSKEIKAKYIILTTLLILLVSINEAVAIVVLPIFIGNFIKNTWENNFRKMILLFGKYIVFGSLLFMLIQNPIRDSLLSPAKEGQRFRLLTASDNAVYSSESEFSLRKRFAGTTNAKQPQKYGIWTTPSLFLFAVSIALAATILKDKLALSFAGLALISGMAGLTVLNTYWPPNALRFITQGYQLAMIAAGLVIISLLKSHSKFAKIIGAVSIIVFIPSAITASAKIVGGAFTGSYEFYQGELVYKNKSLEWLYTNTSHKDKTLFIDEYPYTSVYSPITMAATVQKGLFAPTVISEPKVVNIDFAAEWFDAMAYLSPNAIQKLDPNYLYIQKNSLQRLNTEKNQMLNDKQYFSKVYEDHDVFIYRIHDAYKKAPESDETILSNTANSIFCMLFSERSLSIGNFVSIKRNASLSLPVRDS